MLRLLPIAPVLLLIVNTVWCDSTLSYPAKSQPQHIYLARLRYRLEPQTTCHTWKHRPTDSLTHLNHRKRWRSHKPKIVRLRQAANRLHAPQRVIVSAITLLLRQANIQRIVIITTMIQTVKLMSCFSTPRKGRDSEHWDTFKQKYPTDSFTKTSLYGKDYTARRRKRGIGMAVIRNVFG